MKKWKFSKNKHKNIPKSPENQNIDDKDEPKQIGIYHDFLIFDHKDKYKEENFDFQDCNFNDLSLKDWLILKKSSNQNESRFSSLFQEILENDKKKELEEINEQKNQLNLKDNNNSLDNKNIINYDMNNISNNINDNNINNNANIINTNEKNNNDNMNKELINKNINIIINSRNNSETTNADTLNANFIQDRNPSELSLIYPNNYSNLSLMFPNSYDAKKNMHDNFSDPNKRQNSIYSNFSGPQQQKNSIYSKNFDHYEHKKCSYNSPISPLDNSINEFEYNFTNSLKSNSSLSEINEINNSTLKSHQSKKKFELNLDIKKIINLEDRRTTIMIKNIPNKFTRDLLLNIIDQNFKGTYDIFILPTDSNNLKNYGYSFINFTSSYYIPYFYYLFNGKKWSSTNSLKICEITYSKIQGRNNLLSHYSNKITFRNDEAKKYKNSVKYIIPNEYRKIFDKAFPNQYVEEYSSYFVTKIPLKY